jgi:hypothetical protein
MTRRRRLSLAAGIAVLGAMIALETLSAQRAGGYDLSRYSGNVRYDGKFTFVRMSYGSYMGRGQQPWAHDYPWGERRFMTIMTAVSNLNAHVNESSIMSFDDPEIFKNPVIYLVEPGYMHLSEEQARNLRNYLLKGGFLIVDDFPRDQWGNFEFNMTKVLPDGEWKELSIEHEIFHSFFDIASFETMPPSYNLGGVPMYFGMFEGNDIRKRMYVMVNYQQDISEYWEASAQGIKLLPEETNQAFKFGVNQFIYGILH